MCNVSIPSTASCLHIYFLSLTFNEVQVQYSFYCGYVYTNHKSDLLHVNKLILGSLQKWRTNFIFIGKLHFRPTAYILLQCVDKMLFFHITRNPLNSLTPPCRVLVQCGVFRGLRRVSRPLSPRNMLAPTRLTNCNATESSVSQTQLFQPLVYVLRCSCLAAQVILKQHVAFVRMSSAGRSHL